MTPENIPVVYIAGPYRAATRMQVNRHVRQAEEIGAAVLAMGAMPIIPHANTFFMDGSVPDEQFLAGDLAILLRCDALVLCGDWTRSEGVAGELKFANLNDIPDFDWESEQGKFGRWLKRFATERTEVAACDL